MAKAVFHLRIDSDDLDAFKSRADELGRDASDLARELMRATAENRITIRLSEEDRNLKEKEREIYHD